MPFKFKERESEYKHEWYIKNKVEILKKVRINEKKYKKTAVEFIKEFLSKNPCVDCGEKDWMVLEFDHVRGIKYKAVSKLLGNGNGLKKIKEEIAKCEVRCANCHRRKTNKERGFYRYIPIA